TGAAYCWGNGWDGQLGNGSNIDISLVPTPVAGGLTFAAISASGEPTCGLSPAGAACGWGHGGHGRLGTGDTAYHLVPEPVAGGFTFTDIAAGGITPAGSPPPARPTAGDVDRTASSAAATPTISLFRHRWPAASLSRPYPPGGPTAAGSPPPAPPTAGGTAATAASGQATPPTISYRNRSPAASLSRPYPPGWITPAGSPPPAPPTAGGMANMANSATATPKTALSQRRSLPPRKLAAPPPRPRVAQANFERCSCCSHGRLRL